MEFKYTLQETLEARFTDKDEMNDIHAHGIQCGYDGFLYTHEINEFFNEFESEIEDYFYNIYGDAWLKDSGAADCDCMDALRAHLVWNLVGWWVCDKVEECEEELAVA